MATLSRSSTMSADDDEDLDNVFAHASAAIFAAVEVSSGTCRERLPANASTCTATHDNRISSIASAFHDMQMMTASQNLRRANDHEKRMMKTAMRLPRHLAPANSVEKTAMM